jgi:excisionase family DNA binding protein
VFAAPVTIQAVLVTLDEAAEDAKIGRRTVQRWIAEGKIRSWKREGDRRTYVDRDEVRKTAGWKGNT